MILLFFFLFALKFQFLEFKYIWNEKWPLQLKSSGSNVHLHFQMFLSPGSVFLQTLIVSTVFFRSEHSSLRAHDCPVFEERKLSQPIWLLAKTGTMNPVVVCSPQPAWFVLETISCNQEAKTQDKGARKDQTTTYLCTFKVSNTTFNDFLILLSTQDFPQFSDRKRTSHYSCTTVVVESHKA